MAVEVEAYGIDNVLKRFDLANCTDYAVFAGQKNDKWNLKFPCVNEDDARQIFENNIRSIDPGNDATYQVRFYKKVPSDGEVDNGTPYQASFNFKVRPKMNNGDIVTSGGAPNSAYFSQGMNGDTRYLMFLEKDRDNWKEKAEELVETVSELQEQIEALEDGEQDEKMGMLGTIGRVGEQFEWMQPLLGKVIDIADRLTTGAQVKQVLEKKPPGAAARHVKPEADTPEDVKKVFGAAVSKMMGYYTQHHGKADGEKLFAEDMARLANMTDDPSGFDFLIDMLRQRDHG